MENPQDLTRLLTQLSTQEYCYLTTIGRVSGRPHEIEIWFGVQENSLYLLSGSQISDWVKNLRKNPAVTVRISEHNLAGTARLVTDKDEDLTARYLLAEKYQEWEEEGKTLSHWAETALPVAIDINSIERHDA